MRPRAKRSEWRGNVKRGIVDFNVFVDYRLTIDEMIAAGGYGHVPADLTDEDRGLHNCDGVVATVLHVVCFGEELTSEKVLDKLAQQRLRHAEMPEFLALGAQFPALQLEYDLVTLYSRWRCQHTGVKLYPGLTAKDGLRKLAIHWNSASGLWHPPVRFVAAAI